jgi:lysophospholipase L1-like esterase
LDLWVLAANRGTETILTYPMLRSLISRLSYHGGYTGKTVAGFPDQFDRVTVPVAGDEANPVQVEALATLVSIAREHGVTLMLVEPPMPASVEAQPEIHALQQQFRKLAAEYGLPYVQGADGFPTNDPALFSDSNHLSTAGRELYTARFSATLNAWRHAAIQP